mgnify:CR=1 FL=1
MEKFKSANELYRLSGSELPFKTWLTQQKQNGQFFYNKKLNEKIMNNSASIGMHSFHSADATPSLTGYDATSQAVESLATAGSGPTPFTTPASTAPTAPASKFSRRDATMVIVGAGVGLVALFLILKHK